MKKQLLIENYIVESSCLKEIPVKLNESVDIDGKQSMILRVIQGPMGLIEHKTGNGRMYPENEVMSAIESLIPKMKAKTVYGQLDHPKDAGSYKEVSHFVNNLWTENHNGLKYLFGEWAIIDTPNGRILNTIYEAGGGIGASYRGYGNVDEESGAVSDYEMITVDAVVDPSANTYLIDEETLREGKEPPADSKVNESLTERITQIQEMVESLKADSVKKKISEVRVPVVTIVEDTTSVSEEAMKVKILKDTTIGDTEVKEGQTVTLDDASALDSVDAASYEVVAEKVEPKTDPIVEGLKADITEKSLQLEKSIKAIEELKAYTLKVETVGDTVGDALRKSVKEGQTANEALAEMVKYAKTLESTVDEDLAPYIKKATTAIDEMTAYAKKLEKTIDEELAPYARKLEEVIDKDLIPYTKKLESVIQEMTDGVKSGKIYENIDKDHQALIEKFVQTYPHLEALKEELLQTRDEDHLEERLQKYLTLFASRTSRSTITGNRTKSKKLVGENKVSHTRGETLMGKYEGTFGADLD